MPNPAIEGRACYWGGFRLNACQYTGSDRDAWMASYLSSKSYYEIAIQTQNEAALSRSRIKPQILSALAACPSTMREVACATHLPYEGVRAQIIRLQKRRVVRPIGTRHVSEFGKAGILFEVVNGA